MADGSCWPDSIALARDCAAIYAGTRAVVLLKRVQHARFRQQLRVGGLSHGPCLPPPRCFHIAAVPWSAWE